MIIKGTSAKLEMVSTTAADLHVSCSWIEYVDAASTATPKQDTVIVTVAGTNTIIAGVGNTTSQRVKSVQIRNVDASVTNEVTLNHYDTGGTAAELLKVTLLAGESLTYDGGKWIHNASNYGTFTPVSVALASDQSNATITPTELTGLSVVNVQPGTYVFEYHILYQSSIATTGVRFDVNFTGTVTSFVWQQLWSDVSATASTAVPDQDNIGAAGHVVGSFASRAKGTAGRGVTLSVDTANADMYMRIVGLMIVTVAGDLELWHGSETAASTTIKAGTSLNLTKTG